jgi:hypothetical protein
MAFMGTSWDVRILYTDKKGHKLRNKARWGLKAAKMKTKAESLFYKKGLVLTAMG